MESCFFLAKTYPALLCSCLSYFRAFGLFVSYYLHFAFLILKNSNSHPSKPQVLDYTPVRLNLT